MGGMLYVPDKMSVAEIIGLSLALLVMLVGLAGTVVPGMPGTPLVLLAAIGHRLYFGAHSVSNTVLAVLAALTALSLALDFVATALGARKFGATWRGAVGAVVGGLVGLFFALPGIILGPLLGATLFEMLGDKRFKNALKSGTGSLLGLLLAGFGKFAICVVMIILFATNVVVRSPKLTPNNPEELTTPSRNWSDTFVSVSIPGAVAGSGFQKPMPDGIIRFETGFFGWRRRPDTVYCLPT